MRAPQSEAALAPMEAPCNGSRSLQQGSSNSADGFGLQQQWPIASNAITKICSVFWVAVVTKWLGGKLHCCRRRNGS